MRKLLFFLPFLIAIHPLTGQNNVHIAGKIVGYPNKEVQFYVPNNYLEFKNQILSKVITDEQGHFATRFELLKAQPISLSYGVGLPMTIWIEPKDSMSIDITKQMVLTNSVDDIQVDRGMVVFSGANALLNNYLFDAGLAIPDLQIHQAAKDRSIQQYKIFLDSIENARLILKKKTVQEVLSIDAEEYIYGEVVSATFYNKAMSMVYKRKPDHKDTLDEANPEFYNFWTSWKFLSDKAIISPGYRNGLLLYFNRKSAIKVGKVKDDKKREKFFAVAYDIADHELTDSPATHEYMTAFYLYHMLSFIERKDNAAVLAARFRRAFPNSSYYPIIEKKLNVKQNIAKPAPEILALDTSNHLVNLKDLRGKVIYVDIWASWCGPCLQEFPNSIKLAEKFKDKPVKFVYLNIDDTDKAWRKVMRDKGLKGLHLRADKEVGQKIKSTYGINSIPRYILIDRNGNLISATAKRPREVEQDILKLLRR